MAPNRTSAALGCLSSALELLPRFLDIPCESFQSRAEGRPDAWLPLRHPPCEPKKRHAQIEARHDVEGFSVPSNLRNAFAKLLRGRDRKVRRAMHGLDASSDLKTQRGLRLNANKKINGLLTSFSPGLRDAHPHRPKAGKAYGHHERQLQACSDSVRSPQPTSLEM